ncbi:3760_t:CDS:10, partial [Entrophospora sp. SA101]
AIPALQRTGRMTSPALEFDDEGVRFMQRFRMYRNLGSPAIFTYNDYKKVTNWDHVSTLDLLNASLQNFQSAKITLAKLKNLNVSECRMEFGEVEFKEIMDPKMDSGMILESDLKKKNFNLQARLKPEQVLGIINNLFICEEEDFSLNKYNITIYEDFPESEVLKLLGDAENWLRNNGSQWIRNNGKNAQKEIANCSKLLNEIKSEDTADLEIDVDDAFDPLINRKFVSQTPPRPIQLLTLQEAIILKSKFSLDEMLNLLKNLNSTCLIIDYISATSLMSTIRSEERVLGKMPIFQLVKDSITELTNPPYVYFVSKIELLTSAGHNTIYSDEVRKKISKLVHVFVDSSEKPLMDLCQILCHNRSRQRRNMCNVLTDWELLQEKAEHIDLELQGLTGESPLITKEGPSFSFHLSSWVYHRKLTLIEDILFIGFELELYGTHEFPMIYWYIDYLLGVHYQHLDRISIHANDHRKSNLRSISLSKSITSLIINQQILTMAKQDLCRGIYRAIPALQRTGRMTSPALEFDDEGVRFMQRFRMYRNLGSPAIFTYNDYKKVTNWDHVSTLDLLNASLQNFQSAKITLAKLKNLNVSECRMEFGEVEFKEEEDFSLNKYNITIYEDFPESEVLKLLGDAENWLRNNGSQWIRNNGKNAQKEIANCSKLLNEIKSEDTADLEIDVDDAFDPLINRKFVSQTPPRPIQLLTLQEAIILKSKFSLDEMLNLLKNLNSTCLIIDYISATSLMSTIRSEERVLGKMPIFQLVKDSITELTNPPYVYFVSKIELLTSAGHNTIYSDEVRKKISKLVHVFVDSSEKPLMDLCQILCHNRSRQRRNMCNVLTDWELLQEKAEHIDLELQGLTGESPLITKEGPSFSFHLSSWVYHRKLTLIEDILFIGFELELYGTHEFPMIYWYIDYLLGVHYQHLDRISIHANDHRKSNLRSISLSKSITSLIINQQILTMAKQDLCRGIYRAIPALQRTGRMTSPALEFDDEGVRFMQRFRMYRNLGSPAIFTYNDYKKVTNWDHVSTLDLLNASLQNFQSAKITLAKLKNLNVSECRMEFGEVEFKESQNSPENTLVNKPVNLEFIYHPWYPVIQLKQ